MPGKTSVIRVLSLESLKLNVYEMFGGGGGMIVTNFKNILKNSKILVFLSKKNKKDLMSASV